MKEIKSPIVIGIALVVMAMTGCDNKQQKDSAQNVAADSTQVENTDEASDKFTTKKITKSVKNATGDYELIMDFPEGGNDILVNAIREYISESLGSTYGGGEEESKQGSYSGELADGEKMADYYFNLKVKDVSDSYRVYRTRLLRKMSFECDNFDIVEEILIKLRDRYPRREIREIPVYFNKRAYGESKRDLGKFILSYLATIRRLKKIQKGSRS